MEMLCVAAGTVVVVVVADVDVASTVITAVLRIVLVYVIELPEVSHGVVILKMVSELTV